MYANGKMITVETILQMGRGIIRRMVEGVNSSIIHSKNFYKCHNVPPMKPSNYKIYTTQKKTFAMIRALIFYCISFTLIKVESCLERGNMVSKEENQMESKAP
jgi:hypothetical protein